VVVSEQITHRLCEHIELFVNDVRPRSLVFTSVKGSPLLNRTSPQRSEQGCRHGEPLLPPTRHVLDPLAEVNELSSAQARGLTFVA